MQTVSTKDERVHVPRYIHTGQQLHSGENLILECTLREETTVWTLSDSGYLPQGWCMLGWRFQSGNSKNRYGGRNLEFAPGSPVPPFLIYIAHTNLLQLALSHPQMLKTVAAYLSHWREQHFSTAMWKKPCRRCVMETSLSVSRSQL